MPQYEQLWARRTEPATFNLCCIPFFNYGLALGDTVQTEADELKTDVLSHEVEKGAHTTYRLHMTPPTGHAASS